MSQLTAIAFDADDTLWQNEAFFRMTQARFLELLAPHADAANLETRLVAAERRNIGAYGFGVKGFTLSMIETAIEVTEGRVPAGVIGQILGMGRDMLAHSVDLLPHAESAVRHAHEAGFRVLLITKGDLLHQERKLAQSGLGELFHGVEIVSDKTPEIYVRAFARHGLQADQAMMIGNSMKSDVLPMLEAGGWGVFVPHELEWAFERANAPEDHPRFRRISDLGALPALIDSLT
jgi:putative hydrolase of the HAD superfamily